MNRIFPFSPRFSPPDDWLPKSAGHVPGTLIPEESLSYSGKLLLRDEIPLDEKTFTHYLSQSFFTPVKAIETSHISLQCRRCGNQTRHLFGSIPCARCHSHHPYCRNCIEMGRVLSCEPLYYWTGPEPFWSKQKNPCSWNGELSRFQKDASRQIAEAMIAGSQELLVFAVCGAGKTEMIFEGITEALQQGKRICLATPRADVVRELLPRFRSAFSETAISGLYGGSEEKNIPAQLVLSTTHQLLRFAHAFDVLIIDEIDAFPYHNDPSLHFAANRAAKPDAARIYLTATPRKKQQQAINSGQLPAVFVPVRFHGHPLPVPELRLVFNLKKALTKNKPPKAFYHWLSQRKNPGRQLLIFLPVIQLTEGMLPIIQDFFTNSVFSGSEKGNKTLVASVHASDSDREAKVTAFRNKKIDILLTTTILERGVTFPSVDVVALDAGHAVFDQAALVQIAGRAGRSPDDPTGEVIFFHDGKTEAMVSAIRSIREMNRRGRR